MSDTQEARRQVSDRLLGSRPELATWLRGLGVDPRDTYRVEIVIEAGKVATLTAYQYAKNEQGYRYSVPSPGGGREAAKLPPEVITINSLPHVPASAEEGENSDGEKATCR